MHMHPSPHWKQRLTGTMLGQLQLATYAAVLVGFTAATTAGLWLSERTRLKIGEEELRAGSDLVAEHLMQVETDNQAEVLRELSYHSNSRNEHWLERPDGRWSSPRVSSNLHCRVSCSPPWPPIGHGRWGRCS